MILYLYFGVLAHFSKAEAHGLMVVDDADGLKVRIDDHCPNKFETALLQIFGHKVGEGVARNGRMSMRRINKSFTVCERPYIMVEAAELLLNFQKGLCVADHGSHLARRAYHALRLDDALHISLCESGHSSSIKLCKTTAQNFAFAEY